MPKSRVRKNRRTGKQVRMRHQMPDPLPTQLPAISQQEVAALVQKLDDLIREVPVGYNPTDMQAVVEHHHHASQVITFMRDNFIIETFSMLAGGEMIVQADIEPGSYADRDESTCACPIGVECWCDLVDVPLFELDHRVPGQSRDASGRTVAQALPARSEMDRRAEAPINVASVQAAIDRTRQLYQGDELYQDGSRCPVCGRIVAKTKAGGYRAHKRVLRGEWCPGAPSLAPVRTVVR